MSTQDSPTKDQMVAALIEAYEAMAIAFNRIHGLPRGSDSEIANRLAHARARIEKVMAECGEKLW